MGKRSYKQIDVFSHRPGDGNPLAVVLDAQGSADQVSHEAGLDGHRVLERVFHRSQGRDGVRARADAADAFHEGPYVPRVPLAGDHLNAAVLRGGRPGIFDDTVPGLHFHPQVAFDARYRVNDHPAGFRNVR